MLRRLRGCLLPTLLLLLPAFGCGSKIEYPVAPVSGRVLLDKRPLANARVHFRPITPQGAPESYGETDDNGHYTLEVVTNKGNEKGAVVGEHQVYISLPGYAVENTKNMKRPPAEVLPARYSGSESKLRFTVPPEGSDKADFLDLTSK
jgi:hypothetical protein